MTSTSVTVWAPDDKVCYVKGQVPKAEWDAVKNAVLHVLLPSGQLKTCARHQTFRANDDPKETKHLNDLTVLVFLDEANLLAALSRRYTDNAIYTYMANILIAINPYKDLPLYDIQSWKATKRVKEPHVFDIAQQALTQMNFLDARTLQYQPQSIICCGESGSGKTVSTKQIMRYLCSTGEVKGGTSLITQQVLDANPILEAFGNAKTRRNHNSSRFAKFIKMYFSDTGSAVQAAFTETYLLERSRLVAPPTGERNFHIFYYLAHRRHVQEKFRYLGSENLSAQEAVTQFQDVEQRLRHFQFAEPELSQLWNVCSGLLYLGNIGTAAKEGHQEFTVPPESLPALSAVAKYWGLKEEVLQRFLERRNLYVRQEVVEMKLSVHEAHINRDSIAKTLYVKLFQWLVTRINQTIGQDQQQQQS